MKKLLFLLLLTPVMANAQLQIGTGGGVCKTNVQPPNYGSVNWQYNENSAVTQPLHVAFDGQLSYIIKNHFQVGGEINIYQVSYGDHRIVYGALFTPKVFVNYILKVHRFDIYAGPNVGMPFAAGSHGFSFGGNLGSNFNLSKHVAFYMDAIIEHIHTDFNHEMISDYSNTFTSFVIVGGIKYTICRTKKK